MRLVSEIGRTSLWGDDDFEKRFQTLSRLRDASRIARDEISTSEGHTGRTPDLADVRFSPGSLSSVDFKEAKSNMS